MHSVALLLSFYLLEAKNLIIHFLLLSVFTCAQGEALGDT